jgi:hypothetical protein
MSVIFLWFQKTDLIYFLYELFSLRNLFETVLIAPGYDRFDQHLNPWGREFDTKVCLNVKSRPLAPPPPRRPNIDRCISRRTKRF